MRPQPDNIYEFGQEYFKNLQGEGGASRAGPGQAASDAARSDLASDIQNVADKVDITNVSEVQSFVMRECRSTCMNARRMHTRMPLCACPVWTKHASRTNTPNASINN